MTPLDEEIASDPYVAIEWGNDDPTTVDAETTVLGRQPIECRVDRRCLTTRCPWCGPWLTSQVTPLPAPLPEAPRPRETLLVMLAEPAAPIRTARRPLLPIVVGALATFWILIVTYALAGHR